MVKSNFFMKHRKKIILVTMVLVLGIVGVGYFYFGNQKPVMANQEMIQEYATVTKGNIELTVTGSGAIESSSKMGT